MTEEFGSDDVLVGRVIAGKFGLRRKVGSGASGAVFEADQLVLGRTVAVKVLRSELARDSRFVARFHDEALAASRLNHPNTVSVIDYGQTEDGLLYLVMEFLRGPTLTHVLRNETLRPSRVADLVAQILSGLEEAHDAGVVHADLKADNVVVERRRGDWDLVKVVDFGIARLVGQPTKDGAEKTICGTPEYMAPEVIQGEDPTYASDIYAVGVILYELLIGSTPFAGGASIEVLRRHLVEQPIPPSLRRPDLKIDPVLEDCALRALSKEPGRRFPSATEFRVALTRVMSHPAEAAAAVAACASCGTENPIDYKFCPNCGQPRHHEQPILLEKRPASAGKATVPRGGTMLDQDSATLDGIPTLVPPDDTASVTGPASAEVSSLLIGLPIVGRTKETDRLVRFLRGSEGENSIQVIGPRGSGKSRLIGEALGKLGDSATVLFARRDPSEIMRPMFPIRTLVRGALGLTSRDRIHDLDALLATRGLSPRDAPAMAEILGVEGPLWQLEPTVRRREMLASLNRLLALQSDRRRLVVVFEDVDRYDHPSQEAVRRVIETARGRPALRVVVSNGPELAERWPSSLPRLELGPLSSIALDQLVKELRAVELGEELPDAAELERLAGGNPGHVLQLVRYVVEGGSADSAPSNKADLVAARIDHLPHLAKLICQVVAVLGEEARLSWLRSLAELEENEVRQALSIVVARSLMVEIEDGDAVRFGSSLVRDVVYDSTPAHVRRDLHSKAAQLLTEKGEPPSLLGHHHELAGNFEQAAPLLSHGGDDAAHELDELGARRLFQRALGAARQVLLADDDPAKRAQFVTVAVKLAESLRVSGELGLARGLIEEVQYHCAESRALRAQLLRASAHLQGSKGEVAEALRSLREAIGLSIISGQRDLLCELYLDVATTQLREGQVSAATSELEEGIDLVTAGEGGAGSEGPPSLWRLLLRLAQLYALDGKRPEAVRSGQHALRHANRVGARVGAARIQSMLAGQLEEIGDTERARALRRAAVEEMRRLGDRRATAELLLDGARPTKTYAPIGPSSLREAQELAEEIGWTEGVERARALPTNRG
ncbi:MAG TPA: protein kinase [Kofleriaceae bacterium]|nr:protein kinase [Kofleriaceae bacterium]